MRSEVAEIAPVAQRQGQFQELLKTQVIFAKIIGRGHRSRTLLNLLASFFHLPLFENVLSPLCVILRSFLFSLLFFNSSI